MKTILTFIAAMLLLAGCSNSRPADVPRRKAFPRIELPDSSFVSVGGVNPTLNINRAAEVQITRNDASGTWLDVEYPGLDARIYLTLTPVTEQTLPEVVDNRAERIAMNIDNNPYEEISLEANGFVSKMYVTYRGSTLPVQFIAVDPSVVATGTAEISVAANDSIRPVVDMLSRDILHLLKTIGNGD